MCIGVIGGVGPQAGVDVTTKIQYATAGLDAANPQNTLNKTIERKPWYRQARDMPSFILNSAPQLDGTTQNNWGWANQAEQVSNIGKVINDIDRTFPPCVRDRGVVGLVSSLSRFSCLFKTSLTRFSSSSSRRLATRSTTICTKL